MNLGAATTFADGKLTYHQTVVCELLDDGRVRLDSGGYRTATTKRRMNQFAEMLGHDWRVVQRDHEWYVVDYDSIGVNYLANYDFDDFFDGMIVEGR